ncbi:DUF2085 domain-containing protein [Aliifodinibius sp. S!AR15-10]|uniref:DUF2085 domain-containing protein n=1 Tax=Aliifodinibius sp. S!AR15-10 TaxID=2950437 RepID=UPI002863B8F8|nr:DUF2085 domain-containing protein [Aliifodinibius sp. S!AR15-10]MDR8393082.1 DUF2085 domain-containing protein [Aliifodinibius sp. S!AR15-10]
MIYSTITRNRVLYFGVALLSLLLVMVGSGGGLFGYEGFWIGDWQHKMFRTLCHQDPSRSFWINGKPMAVCARCYGIYAGFSLFWLSIPLLGKINSDFFRYTKKMLLVAILLNIVDVVGNLLGFWQNSSISRSILGAIIGSTAVLTLAREFLKSKTN